MKCTIKWTNFLKTILLVETGTKNIVCMDINKINNIAPKPMEMILLGAGGCTMSDVILIITNSKQNIEKCKIKISSTRNSQNPKIFTNINFIFFIYGNNLNTNIVKNAIKLSFTKYCSAIAILNKTAKIKYSYKIINTNKIN